MTHSSNHFVRGKKKIIYSGCVFVALFIRNAVRMRRIISLYMACLAVQYF